MDKKSEDAKAQHHMIGIVGKGINVKKNEHPDAKWYFQGGNLGLFIHYGLSVVHGKVDLSWGMIDKTPWDEKKGKNDTITPREYWNLAKRFKAEKFDPKVWLKTAVESGMTYAVFTTRHHDGFALWPSDHGCLNTKNHMQGRDLVAEYVKACNELGLKVGLYYSPPDWYVYRYHMSFLYGSDIMAGRRPMGLDHQPIGPLENVPKQMEQDHIDYCNHQIRELLTRYGKIDLIWFDGSVPDLDRAITLDEIRYLQPGIIVNDRLHQKGDYSSQYECKMPEQKPKEPFWEHCNIWPENCGWAHMDQSTGYRSAKWVYDAYIKVKKWGGNMLINVGPKADGTMPDIYYQRMKELKMLMEKERKNP